MASRHIRSNEVALNDIVRSEVEHVYAMAVSRNHIPRRGCGAAYGLIRGSGGDRGARTRGVRNVESSGRVGAHQVALRDRVARLAFVVYIVEVDIVRVAADYVAIARPRAS